MSIYIHIPFCKSICSYCDFCKFFYDEKRVDEYLISLEKEIKKNYKNDLVKTIYIGGGTPTSLSLNQLDKLLSITNVFNNDLEEFTIETNIDLSIDKIKLLKKYNINRVSIGVQTINNKHLKFLNRNHTKEDIINLVKNLKSNGIDNINIDLMYGFQNQTLKELEEDLNFILSLDIKHISIYSLIIEPHTKLYIDNIQNIDEDLDYEMYKLINDKLKENGFIHYEISNYSKENYESKHNLVYWNNEHYYGFGLSASGYLDNIRYENTKTYKKYLAENYISDSHQLSLKETIENEFILGLRKIDGIDINKFNKKYNIDIKSIETVNNLLKDNKLIIESNKIKINPKYIYVSNSILIDFI